MKFQFKAVKGIGIFKKNIEAINKQEVVDYLKENGYVPIEIKRVGTHDYPFLQFFNHVSFSSIVNFTRQLAIITTAGMTLTDALEILKKQSNKSTIASVIENIDKEIKGGSSFSFALKKYPQYFSKLYVSLIISGEASGKLSEIMTRLADDMEKKREFQGKMRNALIYPALIIAAMLGVMFIMVTFVIPKLLTLYTEFKADLPLPTKILIAVSNFSSTYWPFIIAAIVGLVISVKKIISSKKGKIMLDSFVLKIPVIKNVVEMASLVDATRTLSILTSSGVPILEGLEIVRDATTNEVYKNAFSSILKQVEKGVSLGTAMDNENIFPAILVQMTNVGEQTGHLDETMNRVSNFFDLESSLSVKAMTTLIEPAILLCLGLGVLFLVTAIISPIYNLTNSFN